MKIALLLPGPLRSFSECWNSLSEQLIKPIEQYYDGITFKIFIEYFHVSQEFYEQEYEKNIFNSKMEIDTPGWQEILKNSRYFEYQNEYIFKDQYIFDIFEEINKVNNKKYNPLSLKKISKQKKEKCNSFYYDFYVFIQGICLHFNNKKLIDKIPPEFQISIKGRPDTFYEKRYPVEQFSNIEENVVYLQEGERWDCFFVSHTKTLQKLYSNFFKHCQKFIHILKKKGKLKPEKMLLLLLKYEKIEIKKYTYNCNNHWKVNRHLINPKYKRD